MRLKHRPSWETFASDRAVFFSPPDADCDVGWVRRTGDCWTAYLFRDTLPSYKGSTQRFATCEEAMDWMELTYALEH